MNDLSGTIGLIPLPQIPPHMGSGISTAGAGLRRFGILEDDLALDFSSADRAGLVTRLLESCVVDAGRVLPKDLFRELSVGKRIECLLVLAAGGKDAIFGFPFKCEGCGEEIELELTLPEISALQREADSSETVGIRIGEGRLEVRKPTGRDQEVWSETIFVDERDAAAGMIGTLAVNPLEKSAFEPELVRAVEDALDDADPLVNFNCGVNCDDCGRLNERDIDLLETAISMLYRAQQQLILTVHKLASNYHWSEREVFAVPEWRRQRYLELIGAKK